MQRVAILGPGGAGKSRLATEIGRRSGLPVVHLDLLFWRAGWAPAPEDEARHALEEEIANDRWILDGNFLRLEGGEADARFERADTVIFLDLPRRTCIRRVLVRLVRDRRRSRTDLPDGCEEGFDPALLRWIWSYRKTDRPRVLQLLTQLDPTVEVRHLRSRADVERLLESL